MEEMVKSESSPEAVSTEDSFEALYQASLKRENDIKEGQVIPGAVIKVGKDFVTVDIGYKSEGRIPLNEFADAQGETSVKVGDLIDVFLEGTEDDDGLVVLSKEKADKLRIWEEVAQACENGDVVEGRIVSRVKGGLAVDIGVKAFLPGSQVDLVPVRDLGPMLGQVFQFKIIKFNRTRGNIVLSRRVLLEKERESQRSGTLAQLAEGIVLRGAVKNITDYGAFVDLGGIDGLLHITDMSWKRITHPSEVLKVGDEIQVKVLKFDKAKERVSLGLKQITPDPWADADMKYPKNSRIKGKVVSLTDYGAFVEVEGGVEGLIHVSEMSWTKRVKHPSAILSISQEIEAVVLDIDCDNRRMSLGLKQTQPNPWDELVNKYPPGTKIKGVVRNITDFGVFVEVEEGIDGLIHASDLSWSGKTRNPHELFSKNDVVEAVVLNVDPSAERFSLGVKQLSEDPWQVAMERYPIGQLIEGEVTKIADFGVFVRVEEDIEGLVHVSEIGGEATDDLKTRFKPGERISAVVVSVDPSDKKMGLSMKAVQDDSARKELKARAKKSRPRPTLGDIMDEALKKGAARADKDGPGVGVEPETPET